MNSNNKPRSAHRHCTSGLILVVVLVCLMICSAMIVPLVTSAARQRKQPSGQMAVRQAEWLLRSAQQRIEWSIAENPPYRGETWAIPKESLGQDLTASIRIRPADSSPGSKLWTVQATISKNGRIIAKRTSLCPSRLDLGESK